jgi:hypothetical protein
MDTSTNDDDAEDDIVLLASLAGGGVILSFFLALLIAKCADKFCNAKVDEAFIMMRIEELNRRRDLEHKNTTMFCAMTAEERKSILEKVLLRMPYSEEMKVEVLTRKQDEQYSNDDDDIEKGLRRYQKVPRNDGDGRGNEMMNKEDHEKEKEETYENMCPICMEEFEDGTDVVIGHNCIHVYHTECILRWMIAQHDDCPSCRTYLFDPVSFRDATRRDLGEERFEELMKSDHPDIVALYMPSEVIVDDVQDDDVQDAGNDEDDDDVDDDNDDDDAAVQDTGNDDDNKDMTNATPASTTTI